MSEYIQKLLSCVVELLAAMLDTPFTIEVIAAGVVFGAASLLLYLFRGDKRA